MLSSSFMARNNETLPTVTFGKFSMPNISSDSSSQKNNFTIYFLHFMWAESTQQQFDSIQYIICIWFTNLLIRANPLIH